MYHRYLFIFHALYQKLVFILNVKNKVIFIEFIVNSFLLNVF